jgi:ribosome-associated translation inhibitor RaiA
MAAPDKLEVAQREIEALQRYTSDPVLDARVAIRHTGSSRPWVADASLLLDKRVLSAHTAGTTVDEAIELATDRLRTQVVRVSEKRDDLRSAPPSDRLLQPERDLKPANERRIVDRFTYLSTALPTFDALSELYDLDLHFFLFAHVRGDDAVVYRRDDGSPGMIYPRGSVLADEGDPVVAEESWFSEPLTLERARNEMDYTNHRFMYFTAAESGRGHVLYLRHDGDYGLVEPE